MLGNGVKEQLGFPCLPPTPSSMTAELGTHDVGKSGWLQWPQTSGFPNPRQPAESGAGGRKEAWESICRDFCQIMSLLNKHTSPYLGVTRAMFMYA